MSSTSPEAPDSEIELEAKEALKKFFGEEIEFPPREPSLLKNATTKLNPQKTLWLFLYGEQSDWMLYANANDSHFGNRAIEDVLDELFAHFFDAAYNPGKADLTDNQWKLYNYIVSRFTGPGEGDTASRQVGEIGKKVSSALGNRRVGEVEFKLV